MYAQDTSIDQVMPWPGFGYNGTGAGNHHFQGFFNKTSCGPIPLNAAKAWYLQGKLVTETSQRVQVDGSSPDGFAALAGASTSGTQVQVLLNNYQFDYDVVTEITAGMVSKNFMLCDYRLTVAEYQTTLGSYLECIRFSLPPTSRKWTYVSPGCIP